MSDIASKPPIGQFVALIILTGILVLGAKSYGKHGSSGNNSSTASPSPEATLKATGSTNDMTQKTIAKIETSKGTITLELFPKDAPKTVENFTKLAQKGYYDGVIFHRVIKDFVIQGGDPTGTGTGGESVFGKEFEDEINSHKIIPGTLAMANKGPNTNGSQFFIVTEQAQPSLDGKYTVFGQVTDGMDVVKSIAAVKTDSNDKPVEPVKMTHVTIETK